MGKESVVYQTEENLKFLSEYGFKLLFTTHGFRLLGIITSDKKLLEESLGMQRRWIKGLKIENGFPIPPEEKIFETSLHRKNPKSGNLDDIVVHEDSFIVLMERKSFDLSDEDDNFQFIPNMHFMNRVQQLIDDIEAGNRRVHRLKDEKDEAIIDSEHFKREALTSKEREKTQKELLNRLTRDNSRLQERIGNLESAYNLARSRNMEYESHLDEISANATEKGTLKGMSSDDLLIHAVQKKKELYQQMHEIEPDSLDVSEQLQDVLHELDDLRNALAERGKKEPQKSKEPVP